MPAAISATRSETVPLTTPMPCLTPCMAAKRCSNSATSGPLSLPHLPLRSARSSPSSSGSPKTGQVVKGRVRSGVPPRTAKVCDIYFLESIEEQPVKSSRHVWSITLRPRPGLFVGRARRQLRFQIGGDSTQYAAVESAIRSYNSFSYQKAVLSDDEPCGHARLFALQTQK